MNYPDFNFVKENIRKVNPNYLKKNYPEFYKYLLETYLHCNKLTGAMWLFYNQKEQPKCSYCKENYVSFRDWGTGFNEFCCPNCARKGSWQRAEQTKRERYGGLGVSQETVNKRKQTCIEKYGVDNPNKSENILNKRKQTCIEKYGVDHPGKSKEVQEKIHKTMLEKYGVEHALQNPEFLEKSQQTCLKNHGVRYPGQSEEIMQKVKQTQTERYGGMASASPFIREKIKQTNQQKYGRDYGFNYDKVKQTCLERYGDENPLVARCSRGEIKFQGYSKLSQEFCNKLDEIFCPKYTTQYATKTGEKCIESDYKKYYVDYYVTELNLVIEFHGDVWHGNPAMFKPDDRCFPKDNEIVARDLWDIDKIKKERIESTGTKLIVVWESEYKKCKDFKQLILNKLKQQNILI